MQKKGEKGITKRIKQTKFVFIISPDLESEGMDIDPDIRAEWWMRTLHVRADIVSFTRTLCTYIFVRVYLNIWIMWTQYKCITVHLTNKKKLRST
jgi:hypothetical protein